MQKKIYFLFIWLPKLNYTVKTERNQNKKKKKEKNQNPTVTGQQVGLIALWETERPVHDFISTLSVNTKESKDAKETFKRTMQFEKYKIITIIYWNRCEY